MFAKFVSIRIWPETFSEASSRRPFSTKNIFSIFPSPESPFKSRETFSLSSKSSFTDQHEIKEKQWDKRRHEMCKTNQKAREKTCFHPQHAKKKWNKKGPVKSIQKKFLLISSLAFCPAANTTLTGREAKDDQYSYLAPAISACIPAKIF